MAIPGAFGRVYIVQDTNAAIPQQYVMKEVDLCALVGLSDEQAKAQALSEVVSLSALASEHCQPESVAVHHNSVHPRR